jgi:hypothetical protein
VQGRVDKLSPLEEAVAAAAAAANAASVVATEMANTSRELLKSRNEGINMKFISSFCGFTLF